ncbi:uncharacterized protein DEA37_0010211 [Paragonimus westermani]|uniref:Secreted protein n=1 Tax=Paragonimus westermani TaxID=34504 RepID=A0A5J4NY45_9TREM|nr:uncharacterized protein DEA37_0010211 [Paragonimus westermani]
MLQRFLAIVLLGTFVGVSLADSHFGIDCNNGIRELMNQCVSEGYQQRGCSGAPEKSQVDACRGCPGCIAYAKSCLRYNLENTSPVNKCSNARTMAGTLKRQGY